MKRSHLGLSVLGFIAVASAPVTLRAAQGVQLDLSSHTWTEISGFGGQFKEQAAGGTVGVNYGIHRLELSENGDAPNFIQVFEASFATANSQAAGALAVGNGKASGSKKIVDIGADHYVTAIQVCTNKTDDTGERKIKGVRIWGSKLNANGTLAAVTGPEEFDRPSCVTPWQTKMSCPSGSVASAIRAYYKSENKGFSGLSLRCTRLVPKP